MSTYGGRPEDRYGQPSDPWDQPDRSDGGYDESGYGESGYGQPSYGGTGYDGTNYGGTNYGSPGYGSPAYSGTEYRSGHLDPRQPTGPEWHQPEPSGRSSTRLLVTIVVTLGVLLVAGGATAFFVTRGSDKASTTSATSTDGPSGAAAAGAGQTPAAGRSGTPAPESSAEVRFATVGQCVVNDGSNARPEMRIVACGANTYQVLARFDGTIDFARKCGPVKGYKYHYYFDAELNSLDFVLCLKMR